MLPSISLSLENTLLISYLKGKNLCPPRYPPQTQELAFPAPHIQSDFKSYKVGLPNISQTYSSSTTPSWPPFPFLVGIVLHVLCSIPNPLICPLDGHQSHLHKMQT